MAALYAATFPDRVSHLILYGTFAKLIRSDDYTVGIQQPLFERWLEQLSSTWGPAGIAGYAPSVAEDEEFIAWWPHLLPSGTSPRAATALMRMYQDIDVRPALATFSAPALVHNRRGDQQVSPAHASELARQIPGASYVELEGADHLGFVGTKRPSSTRSRSS
jgi:pimeloyl-ACP methyl ester carboxylesterase